MIAFVILHYKNIKDTLECIDSIKTLKCNDYKIVVVDNNSGSNKDINTLKGAVDDLIVLDDNMGFAKGNNRGVSLAREKYNPDFIAVINNDTIIEQKDFINRIEKIYKKYKFDILGPKIITNNGDSVNPFPSYKTLEEVRSAIKKSDKLIKIYSNKILRFCLKIYLDVKHSIKKPIHLENGKTFMEDVSLHGCALIFSKKYLKKYKDAFYNETFLYHEEEFLEYRRRKDNLKFIYDPDIEIFHKEGSSLNHKYNKRIYQGLIFREENIKKSLLLLEKIMVEDKEV